MADRHRPSPSPTASGTASNMRDLVRGTKSKAVTPTRNLSWTIVLVSVVLLLVAGGIFAAERNRPTTTAPSAEGAVPAAAVVRDDSHRLSTAADGKVTLVEFLDFECEACGAVYPTIEQLRTQYDGRVTFVARYLGWLRCRLLSFFETDYYDDVKIEKTDFTGNHVALIAESNDEIVGLIDVEIVGCAATIDSIAVLPGTQREGAATQLLRTCR